MKLPGFIIWPPRSLRRVGVRIALSRGLWIARNDQNASLRLGYRGRIDRPGDGRGTVGDALRLPRRGRPGSGRAECVADLPDL